MPQVAPNNYYPGRMDERSFRQLWDRVTYVLQRIEAMAAEQVPTDTVRQADVAGLKVAIQAVQDQLTQSSTFVNAGNNAFTPTEQTSLAVAGSGAGITLGGTTDAVTVSVSNAAALRAAAGAAQAGAPGAHTITLAQLTGPGAPGSITWNADGVITAFVDPT